MCASSERRKKNRKTIIGKGKETVHPIYFCVICSWARISWLWSVRTQPRAGPGPCLKRSQDTFRQLLLKKLVPVLAEKNKSHNKSSKCWWCCSQRAFQSNNFSSWLRNVRSLAEVDQTTRRVEKKQKAASRMNQGKTFPYVGHIISRLKNFKTEK